MNPTLSFRDGLIAIVGSAAAPPDRRGSALTLLADLVEATPESETLPESLTALTAQLEEFHSQGWLDAGRILRRLTPRSHKLWLTAFRFRVGRGAPYGGDLIERFPPPLELLFEILESLAAEEKAEPKRKLAWGGGRLLLRGHVQERLAEATRSATNSTAPADRLSDELLARIYQRVLSGLQGTASAWVGHLDQAYVDAIPLLSQEQRAGLRKLWLVVSIARDQPGNRFARNIQGLS